MPTEPITDGRRLRGVRSRSAVLEEAVDIASLDGLDALSYQRLAQAADLSKAGVQGLFDSKEHLQLATIEHARAVFVEEVVTPARSAAPGLPRFEALVKRWIAYVKTPVFRGGCFRVANLATFDSRSGPVRDALERDQRDWQALLARELRHAVEAGDLPDMDVAEAAFEVDAVLCATNTALRFGDRRAAARARRIIDGILARGRP